ncbi:MAG: hypothetical protein QNI92_02550 [Desulfobacterales bacterium]|nr:hypothetical protein [Desulfobacterales bacterium]MDJ0912901.1 hypothetical protein [Desulfobacterales bacterium]
MRVNLDENIEKSMNDHMGCFGEFEMDDPICRTRCAVRLRCAVVSDQNMRMEIIEDLAASGDHLIRYQ